ncbi:hypothetical protein H4R35_001350 [Dimargaris xerosporica]|nr:hypothetical protein H4R35_001350 [Dimargaris xerosporica]
MGLLSLAFGNIEKRIFSVTDPVASSLQTWIEDLAPEYSWRLLWPQYTIHTHQQLLPFPPELANLTYYSPAHQLLQTSQLEAAQWLPAEQWYVLAKLDPARLYEVRVSYPASQPFDFELELFSPHLVLEQLNVTLPLPPEDSTQASITATQFLRVRALYAGVSHLPNREKQPVAFNIVLEQLYFYIPFQAYKLVLVILLVVGFAVFVANPIATQTIVSLRDHDKTD